MFREGSAAGRIPHVGHGVAVVGVLDLGATAQQVVGEGNVVGGRGVVGRTFRVNALSTNEQGDAAGLSVDVTITGQIDPSHLVRSRKHIATAAGKTMRCDKHT